MGLLAALGTAAERKVLVAFFSHSGNTRAVAQMIHEQVGGDLFEIESVAPYPKDYDATVDRARKEQDASARPKLARHLPGGRYDVVFLGYPDWWGTMPMPVFTFLEETGCLAGTTVVPFCTHEGSGFGRSIEDLAKACPKARLVSGFSVRGKAARGSRSEVQAWLKRIGM